MRRSDQFEMQKDPDASLTSCRHDSAAKNPPESDKIGCNNSLLSDSTCSSDDLDDARRKNSELCETLFQVRSELESLKLSVQVEKETSLDIPPGTISNMIREIYDAQKEWQEAMTARQKTHELMEYVAQDERSENESVNNLLSGTSFTADPVCLPINDPPLITIERLRSERDTLIDIVASTKAKLDALQIAFSLLKSLTDDFLVGGRRKDANWPPNGQCSHCPPMAQATSNQSPITSGSISTPPELESASSVRHQLDVERKARAEAEEKCQRLERLVAVLRRKLRHKS